MLRTLCPRANNSKTAKYPKKPVLPTTKVFMPELYPAIMRFRHIFGESVEFLPALVLTGNLRYEGAVAIQAIYVSTLQFVISMITIQGYTIKDTADRPSLGHQARFAV